MVRGFFPAGGSCVPTTFFPPANRSEMRLVRKPLAEDFNQSVSFRLPLLELLATAGMERAKKTRKNVTEKIKS